MSSTRPRFASVVFDVDSTLASIEGIDWLAELRDAAVARECAALTAQAMTGELSLDLVYERRLQAIAPMASELQALGDAYRAAVIPGAAQLIRQLQLAGVNVQLVSGGLRTAILPLATDLGVPADHVHAVTIRANANGAWTELDGHQPLATQGGKAIVVEALQLPKPVVIIGDGSTDAAARTVTDAFLAFTGIARRDAVVAMADAEASDFATLQGLLFESDP